MDEAFETGQEGSFDVREKKQNWPGLASGRWQKILAPAGPCLPLLQRPAQASKVWVASVLAVLSDSLPTLPSSWTRFTGSEEPGLVAIQALELHAAQRQA